MFVMMTATQLVTMPFNEESALGKLIYGPITATLNEADAAYIENCKQIFIAHYKDQGYDPAHYPEQQQEYINNCMVTLEKSRENQ